MDPNIVFDCEKNLSNRFALTVAAAARVRALARGSEPRIDAAGACRIELALREIAAGAFAADELFITSDPPAEAKRIAAAAPSTELCGDTHRCAAVTSLARPRERVP